MDDIKFNIRAGWCGIISVLLVVVLYSINYYFVPVELFIKDFDKNINVASVTITDTVTYQFSLSGLKVQINNKWYPVNLEYSGKTNIVEVKAHSSGKYTMVIPLSWKENSLYGIYKKMKTPVNKVVSSSSITIDTIKNEYQKINIEDITFYNKDGIKRLVYNNFDTFKIVTFSYNESVTEPEIYWNPKDAYYYILSPYNVENLFQQNSIQ